VAALGPGRTLTVAQLEEDARECGHSLGRAAPATCNDGAPPEQERGVPSRYLSAGSGHSVSRGRPACSYGTPPGERTPPAALRCAANITPGQRSAAPSYAWVKRSATRSASPAARARTRRRGRR